MVTLKICSQGINNLINIGAQDLVSYVARVSNPENQYNFESSPKLLKYLIKHGHWSPFEHVSLTMEIVTSRAIAAQILRHRSFVFQEYSQRYSAVSQFVSYPARRQDTKNRQNSIDDLNQETKDWFFEAQQEVWKDSFSFYNEALEKGLSKESARFLLPLNTETTILMTGSIRSWIHYINLRSDVSTQLEHREIAEQCKKIVSEVVPDVATALEWTNA